MRTGNSFENTEEDALKNIILNQMLRENTLVGGSKAGPAPK